jgi:hypothetical protein
MDNREEIERLMEQLRQVQALEETIKKKLRSLVYGSSRALNKLNK